MRAFKTIRLAIFDDLTREQRRYIEGLLSGHTKLQAGLDAGYSHSTARNAAAVIERPVVRLVLQAEGLLPVDATAKVSGDVGRAGKETFVGEMSATKADGSPMTVDQRRERAARNGYAASFDWWGNRTAWQVVRLPTRVERPAAGPFDTEEQALSRIERIIARQHENK